MTELSNKDWLEEMKIIGKYNELYNSKLQLIPEKTLHTNSKVKSEKFVKKHFEKMGYIVLNGTIHGYRVIGWPDHWWHLKGQEKKALKTIQSILSSEEFDELAKMIVDKNGCPDLMIIKNRKIEFIEVKSNNETVKPVTIEFLIKLKEKYPISIIRVIKKANNKRENVNHA